MGSAGSMAKKLSNAEQQHEDILTKASNRRSPSVHFPLSLSYGQTLQPSIISPLINNILREFPIDDIKPSIAVKISNSFELNQKAEKSVSLRSQRTFNSKRVRLKCKDFQLTTSQSASNSSMLSVTAINTGDLITEEADSSCPAGDLMKVEADSSCTIDNFNTVIAQSVAPVSD